MLSCYQVLVSGAALWKNMPLRKAQKAVSAYLYSKHVLPFDFSTILLSEVNHKTLFTKPAILAEPWRTM